MCSQENPVKESGHPGFRSNVDMGPHFGKPWKSEEEEESDTEVGLQGLTV